MILLESDRAGGGYRSDIFYSRTGIITLSVKHREISLNRLEREILMEDMKDILSAIRSRRSIYALGKSVPIPTERIVELVGEAIRHTPSAFNMQDQRAAVLFGDHHTKLWSIVLETLRKRVSSEQFAETEKRIGGFSAAFGTVLFFNDSATVRKMRNQFASYAENFETWSAQQQGMAQYAVWTLLEEAGLGANLQHYNPIIDAEVRAEWEIPADWTLRAQLVFGSVEAHAGEKEFLPLSERLKVFR